MPKGPPFHISTHIGDYLRNTPPMGPTTWEHHGIYCSLRFLAWNTPQCRLPTDDLWIAGKMGCTIELFREKVAPVLQAQFKQRRNWWYDDDLSTSYKRAVSLSQKQSNRANHRWGNDIIPSRGNATSLLPSKKQQQHRNSDSGGGKKKKTRRWLSSFPEPGQV